MTEKTLQPPSPPQARARSRTFSPYVLVWAALATISLVYLGLLATQPALVAHYLGTGDTTAESEANQKTIGHAVAEVQALRDTVDLFRNELIEIRAQVSNQSDATREIATRMSALETAAADRVASKEAAPKGAAQQAQAKAPAKPKGAEPSQMAAAAPAQKAAKDAKKTAAKSETGLETGSVASPAAGAITFGPPTVTPTAAPQPSSGGTLIGVQIATGPSVDSLRLSWTLLNERHGDSFRALEPRYTMDVSGSEQTYDLVVGPVASIDEARRLCQELALKATPCSVSRFTGDAL